MKEFRNVTPGQLTLDGGFKVDALQFTGLIDETQPTTAARVADGSLKVVPNGTAAAVGGSPTLPTPSTASELGYAEITANFNPANTANQIIPITGLSVVVAVGARPIVVEGFAPTIQHTIAGADISLQLYEDGSIVQAATVRMDTANTVVQPFIRSRRSPTPGNHTYDLRVKSTLAGTILLQANAGFPAHLHVIER
jgi:hypothetical protein